MHLNLEIGMFAMIPHYKYLKHSRWDQAQKICAFLFADLDFLLCTLDSIGQQTKFENVNLHFSLSSHKYH